MSKEEYKKNLMESLTGLSAAGLKDFAAKNYIRLYSSLPATMRSIIVDTMVKRKYYGNAIANKL